ncbi:MAG: ribonuclease P protein component [Bacteroidales bacterium]|nr:ribonuclease P protein component [Bacteroidales bacterium]
MAHTFRKQERLCSQRLIDRLYADGHRFVAFPYSVQWCLADGDAPCQVVIVAPKRRFRHAVDRNRVKRLTRECWRLRKETLYGSLADMDVRIALSLVYIHHDILAYEQLGRKMDKLIETLQSDIRKHLPPCEDSTTP